MSFLDPIRTDLRPVPPPHRGVAPRDVRAHVPVRADRAAAQRVGDRKKPSRRRCEFPLGVTLRHFPCGLTPFTPASHVLGSLRRCARPSCALARFERARACCMRRSDAAAATVRQPRRGDGGLRIETPALVIGQGVPSAVCLARLPRR